MGGLLEFFAGTTVTVKVAVRYAQHVAESGELARDRQMTVCAGENFMTLEFLSMREALAWASEIRSAAKRLEQNRLSRHIRKSREHFAGMAHGDSGKGLAGTRGLLQRCDVPLASVG